MIIPFPVDDYLTTTIMYRYFSLVVLRRDESRNIPLKYIQLNLRRKQAEFNLRGAGVKSKLQRRIWQMRITIWLWSQLF